MTTSDDRTGAKAGQKNFLCAWSTAYSSTAMPYIGTWTANTAMKYWSRSRSAPSS